MYLSSTMLILYILAYSRSQGYSLGDAMVIGDGNGSALCSCAAITLCNGVNSGGFRLGSVV